MAKHEGLYDLELETGLPIRFAWALFPTACDREGRFQWRPRTLKADVLPHDPVDFSRVLHAWLTRGFIVKYRVGNEWFGWVPTFRKHQVVNTRETASVMPGLDDADEVEDFRNQSVPNASATREPRDDDASATRAVHARGEGKGREGERNGTEGEEQSSLRSDSSSGDDPKRQPSAKPALELTAPADLTERKAERLRQVTDDAIAAFNARLGKPNGLLSAVHATVGREKRQAQVKRCSRVARQICEQQFGSTLITRQFWDAYFAEVDKDPFKSGRQQPGRGHENWSPSFEYLTREEVVLAVFDKATSEAAA